MEEKTKIKTKMKYEEINFGQSVNQVTGESWDKISVKVSLGKDDDKDKCFNEVKEQVSRWHNSKSESMKFWESVSPIQSHLNASNGALPIPIPTIDYKRKESIEMAISICETLGDLEIIQNDCIKYGLVPQYLEKKKSFHNVVK